MMASRLLGLRNPGDLRCLGLMALYFVGYERPEGSPPLASAGQFVRSTIVYFAYALGPGARRLATPAALLVMSYIAIGGALAARAALTRPDERTRAAGLCLFIGGGVALGLAIALARGAYPHRMPDRYALFAVLPLLASTLAWTLYASRTAGRRVVAVLAAVVIILLPWNVRAGFEWRDWYVDGMRRVEADLAANVPLPELARRHHPFLMHWNRDGLLAAMQMLEAAAVGPFAARPSDRADPQRTERP